jgi:hypothetical protein
VADPDLDRRLRPGCSVVLSDGQVGAVRAVHPGRGDGECTVAVALLDGGTVTVGLDQLAEIRPPSPRRG